MDGDDMNKIRLIIVKMIRYILVKLGRGGSLPGTIALKMDPQILSKFKMPDKVIVVTGTNGKTTTSNLMFETLQASGLKVIGNRKGDNLKEGITTLLCANSNLNYEVQADAVVLEIDELTVMRVFKDLSVTSFIILNFFRDQLDRAGEMETIIRRMETVLKDYEGKLILNANDPNVVRLADTAKKAEIYFYGAEAFSGATQSNEEASEGKFCPRCNTPLVYDYYQYSHIGKFHCEKDDFGNNPLTIHVSDVDFEKGTFKANGVEYPVFQKAIYSVYNCAAIMTCLQVNSIDLKICGKVFTEFDFSQGRNESFHLPESCTLNLIKNPTGANEVLKYILSYPEKKNVLIILNDHIQDGQDISWIWDAQFQMLKNCECEHILCAGTRAYDMALRLKYEEVNDHVEVVDSIETGILRLKEYKLNSFVISTYTALQTTRAILRRHES